MKKVLTLLIIIFSLQTIFAQTWCAPGAKWTYSYANNGENGYVELNFTQDTLINSINCKRLFITKYVKYYNLPDTVIYYGSEITYEQNGVVYIRTGTNYDTLYNFNALIGDHWDMVRFNDSTSKITVLDTGTIVINSIPLKFLAVNLHYGGNFPFDYQDTIIERIGFKASYYIASDRYYAGLDGNVGGGLRCYSDDNFNTYKPFYTHACDYIYVGINEIEKESSITIYPNPTSNSITINTDNIFGKITSIEFYNSFGQPILVPRQTNTIDITELPIGLYFIKVTNSQGLALISKFLKVSQ